MWPIGMLVPAIIWLCHIMSHNVIYHTSIICHVIFITIVLILLLISILSSRIKVHQTQNYHCHHHHHNHLSFRQGWSYQPGRHGPTVLVLTLSTLTFPSFVLFGIIIVILNFMTFNAMCEYGDMMMAMRIPMMLTMMLDIRMVVPMIMKITMMINFVLARVELHKQPSRSCAKERNIGHSD